jgi:hypothetical protein
MLHYCSVLKELLFDISVILSFSRDGVVVDMRRSIFCEHSLKICLNVDCVVSLKHFHCQRDSFNISLKTEVTVSHIITQVFK